MNEVLIMQKFLKKERFLVKLAIAACCVYALASPATQALAVDAVAGITGGGTAGSPFLV